MTDFIRDHKRVKHFNIEGHVHLLTFSCFQRQPLLQCDERRALLSKYIDRAVRRHNFGVVAFVYMPEHIHLLLNSKAPACIIEDVLYAIKKPYASCIKQRLVAENNSLLLKDLTVTERPGKQTFRFWQEGPGHDRNLISVESCVKAAEYLHKTLCVVASASLPMNGSGQAGSVITSLSLTSRLICHTSTVSPHNFVHAEHVWHGQLLGCPCGRRADVVFSMQRFRHRNPIKEQSCPQHTRPTRAAQQLPVPH